MKNLIFNYFFNKKIEKKLLHLFEFKKIFLLTCFKKNYIELNIFIIK